MFQIPRNLLYAAIASGAAAALAILYFFDPSTSAIFPPCPTNALTKLHCPGCGTLRAMHALLHGDVKEALSQNILAVILLIAIVKSNGVITIKSIRRLNFIFLITSYFCRCIIFFCFGQQTPPLKICINTNISPKSSILISLQKPP